MTDGRRSTARSASRTRPALQMGLRLQIVLALAGLMIFAFGPLFLAVASLTRATLIAEHVHSARSLGGGSLRGNPAPEQAAIDGAGREPQRDLERGRTLVRLVALYMGVFALALIVSAYFALTRLIVRPIEELAAAADRVASGARTLRVPKSGARELLDLGASVQAMAGELIAEEATLLLKIDQLTETTTHLTQTRAQLVRSERMASVGRLAAGLAHEIGNPLAAIVGMQDLLLGGDLPTEQQRDFLQRMRRETERIHTVVRDLLDFARPEETRAGPGDSHATADVRAVFGDVVSLVQPQPALRGVRLELSVDGSPRVRCSPARLMQVLLNIVLNAGAALVSSGRVGGRIDLRARAEESGERVRIEIEDDGPGIDPSVQDRLFEPFVTTKDVGEGTGLGLAVCRGLVESAGGEIGLDPACTTGARFYVVLPAAASA